MKIRLNRNFRQKDKISGIYSNTSIRHKDNLGLENTTDLVFSPLIIPGVSTIEIPFSTWKMQRIDLIHTIKEDPSLGTFNSKKPENNVHTMHFNIQYTLED